MADEFLVWTKGEDVINVISPDGLPIAPSGFKTLAEAEEGLTLWMARFAAQGYYAAATGERIALADLRRRCQLTTQIREHNLGDEIELR